MQICFFGMGSCVCFALFSSDK